MSSSPCILGVDIGTEGCKAILFNVKGESLARAYRPYGIRVPEPSWAEQNPHWWWNAVRKSVSAVLRKKSVNRDQIACIGVTGQSPVLVPVDRHGDPLMNALIWMDRRAIKQAEEIADTTSVADDASMTLPKILWVKEQRPQIFLKTHKFLQTTDFVQFKLTGKFVTDWFDASTFHFDVSKGRWPQKLLNDLEIPVEKLPDVSPPTEIIGSVTDRAARETGLRKGTPVVTGGIDAYMSVVGVNALAVGSACEITGSSTCLMVPFGHMVSDPKGRVHCEKFPLLPSFWITWGTMSTTGASLRWFRDNFGRPGESYRDMDTEAEEISPGSDGLIFLPYLMGERSPIWDTNARGVFLGFSLNHSRKQFIRAVLEGCAFGIRHNLETIEDLGVDVDEIRSCGGAARSRVFGQIKADVTGKSIIIPREIEAPALGAAIAAAVGIKIYPNLKAAAKNMVQTRGRIYPQRTLKEKYDRYFRMYKDAYLHLKRYFERYHSLKDATQS
jgi:xylulokinase